MVFRGGNGGVPLQILWWLLVDLPNISANTDRFKTGLVSIKRSF